MTKFNPEIEDDGMRETDETYIKEIDTLFKMLQMRKAGQSNADQRRDYARDHNAHRT